MCPERRGPQGTYPAVSRVVRGVWEPPDNQRVVRALFSLLYSEPMSLPRGTLVCQCVCVLQARECASMCTLVCLCGGQIDTGCVLLVSTLLPEPGSAIEPETLTGLSGQQSLLGSLSLPFLPLVLGHKTS